MLRVACFMCYVGHGAFGFYRKEAWVPYFGVVGVGRDTARELMPLVGLMDVSLGISILLSPRPAVLLWMVIWAVWTALLRPLSGESSWEAVERAGNYGAPIAFLLLCVPLAGRWLKAAVPEPATLREVWLPRALALAAALLFVGHGALALGVKPGIVTTMASVFGGAATSLTFWSGIVEVALAIAIVARPSAELALFMACWKLATEALFVTAGAPFWEIIERGGSYGVPLALAILLHSRRDPATAAVTPRGASAAA
ncbi:MAG: hypothetical protein HYR75_01830 [Gemmatimonadetes bacterium]|nr:hypothetical protein [Gemmatimonadota bacterium]